MRRALLTVGLLVACASTARAQQVSATVRMTADRTQVGVGERFQLTVEARCQGASNPQIQLPDLNAFDVVGRRVNTPFSLRFGFGAGTQQVQSTTRHVLTLQAREPGRFELDPAVVELAGQRFESQGLTIEVGDGSGATAAGQPGATTDPPAPSATPGSTADLYEYDPGGFLRTVVTPAEPYVGQQVTVGVYLYVPQPLRGQPDITQEPSTDGFWVQDLLPAQRALRPDAQMVQGRRFHAYTLRRFAAFPLSTGELTIGPTEVSITSSSIFDVFGMRGRQPEPWVRAAVPVTLRVRELPSEGRPPGPVHVGTLSLRAELDRNQIATGDAVTLTLTAAGTGAIEQLRIPGPEVDGLRVLQPEIRDSMSTSNGVVSGTRILRWLVVPERAGDFTLGPFEVAVFDPSAGTYSVARAEGLTLTAAGTGPSAGETPTPEPDADAEDDDARARFGPVRTRSSLARSTSILSEQTWFLATLGLGPLAFLLALGVRTARRRAERDDPRAAPRRARKAAKKRLAAAAGHAERDEPREFYAAIAGALKEVLEAKLARPVGSLTHAELRRTLTDRGMDEDLSSRVVDELEGCDFARFSAVGVEGDEMSGCLERARKLLVEIDRFEPSEEEA